MTLYIPTPKEIDLAIAQLDFGEWLVQVTPAWSWYWLHLQFIRQQLDLITSGEIKRLMLFLPPRHGKSEMTTIRYATWRLENDPKLKVIIGAYNQTLASKFSRKARGIARERIPLSDERVAAEDWETVEGGGVRAVGVGGGITGQGGDLIIIDDPVKSREEANSKTYREKVWDWYTDDLYTRLEPDGSIILIMTRWHEDDLAGRILDSDDGSNWAVVSLPAEAEDNDPLNRNLGAALCPDRYSLDDLGQIKNVLGISYSALYQQRPVVAEGEMFQRGWFEVVDAIPARSQFVRYWDKAGTADGGAYTVGVLMCENGGTFYCVDVIRGQWAAAEREAVIKQTAIVDHNNYGSVSTWVEQEPGSGGKESAEATIRNLAGYTVRADRVTGDKITRAEPLAAQAAVGNIKLLRGAWIKVFLDELTAFPQRKYKDQVDAAGGAFSKLAVNTGEWGTNPFSAYRG